MISVIVPVYKVEQFLDRCLTCLVNQTYKDLEIILVDDGSPDKCPQMCEDWAKKDNRIKVVHKKNGGLSDARNAGMEEASGDYIAFLDSDDYIDLDMYKTLYNKMQETNADIVCGRHIDVDEKGNTISRVADFLKKPDYNKKYTGKEYTLRVLNGESMPVAWDKLYKRDVIGDVKFTVNATAEDLLFNLELCCKDISICFVEDALAYYTSRSDSITGGSKGDFKEKYYYDVVKNLFDLEQMLLNNFGDDIILNLKTSQLTAIRFFLNKAPYEYVKQKNEVFQYVVNRLKENKKYIFKGYNTFADKMFLYLFLISNRGTKRLLIVLNAITS